ncbi:hypothetical protein DFH09DRAFT_296401 [Mycena vulgaris]|nr:hypothetical protein DFH09DRAFT_296401 [Mycena vulgaris]
MEPESSTRRTTKKRKSDNATVSAPKRPKITKKQGRLAGLLDISLDVVFEIFGNLHPLDVLRLSRTSKEFRNLLMHKSSITIWRSSLNNVPNLPPCAPGMTEPQWISLVFDSTCHVCQKIARKVDWGLFIRICTKCAKTSLESQFRGFSNYLLELIPVRRDNYKPLTNNVYFVQEREKIRDQYNAIKDPEELKKFVEERKELVQSLKEHTKLCEAWSEGIAENRGTELADLKEGRFMAITAKLTALGWGMELENIPPSDSLRTHKLVKQPHALTERTWNTIKPEMVSYMEQMKRKRLDREHATLVLARKAIATKVLRTFKRSQLPWTDIMPCAPDFWDFPEIKNLLRLPSEIDVDEQSFEAMLPAFPGMIATWREGLVQQLAMTRKLGSSEDATEDDDEIKRRLTLATSVFRCDMCGDDDFDDMLFPDYGIGVRCRPLFWPRVLAHRCLTKTADYMLDYGMPFMEATRDIPWRSRILSVDTHVGDIVKKIVVVCGMDPATATVEDMDVANPRLACHACAKRDADDPGRTSGSADPAPAADAEPDMKPATVRAFSWREAVRHEGETHRRQPTAWYMLSDADAAAARTAEAEAMQECRKAKVNTTVQDVVDNAVDMVVGAEEAPIPDSEGNAADDGVRILPSELPEVAWSCAHCLDGAQERPPMALGAMLRHLAARHEILGPAVLNEDYYRTLAAPEVYSKEHFPAPALIVSMPPIPPLPSPPPRHSNFHYDYDYDSEDEGFGFPFF